MQNINGEAVNLEEKGDRGLEGVVGGKIEVRINKIKFKFLVPIKV